MYVIFNCIFFISKTTRQPKIHYQTPTLCIVNPCNAILATTYGTRITGWITEVTTFKGSQTSVHPTRNDCYIEMATNQRTGTAGVH
jgi:hypothetical protein